MSTNTTCPPANVMDSADAKKVNGVVKTISPALISFAIRGSSKASVPLEHARTCLTPIYSASCFSSSLTSGPIIYWP